MPGASVVTTIETDGMVFVVDDDESVRKMVGRLIRLAGLDVKMFASAGEFMSHPLPDQPLCVLLDVRLPGTSGLDLQERLGKARPDIPVVFMTGHGDVRMSVRAMQGGAVDFLEKPLREQDLLDGVHRALARSREARTARLERSTIETRLTTLTSREKDVLGLVVTGMLNKQIAAELGISERTVKIHRGRVMRKMQADSVATLVRLTEKIATS